jgi:hypothetical protein
MNVIVTIILVVVLAGWAFVVYNRVLRLREQVRDAWRKLEPQQDDAALRDAYNTRVKIYNNALAVFPANVVAMLAGFTPAKPF